MTSTNASAEGGEKKATGLVFAARGSVTHKGKKYQYGDSATAAEVAKLPKYYQQRFLSPEEFTKHEKRGRPLKLKSPFELGHKNIKRLL